MKLLFSIKYRPQIESGEYKVVTRDGHPVRIICWDRKSAGDGQPIVALVENGHYENSIWVEENGVYKGTMGHEYDLFIITPELELTPLAQALSDYLKNDFEFFARKEWDEKKWNEVMNTQAGELLAIAKKELLKQWDIDMANEYERGKREGLTLGYNKAMKEYNESVAYHYDNPPYVFCRFGGICNNPMKDCLNCPMNPVGLNTTTTTSGTCKKED